MGAANKAMDLLLLLQYLSRQKPCMNDPDFAMNVACYGVSYPDFNVIPNITPFGLVIAPPSVTINAAPAFFDWLRGLSSAVLK